VAQKVAEELASTCPGCTVLKLSMNDDTGSWTTDIAKAAVSPPDAMTPAQQSSHLTNMHSLQQQRDNTALDCREVLADAAAAVPKTVTTSVRQIFISTWSLACFAGMVVIAGIFISQSTRCVLYPSNTFK
jgi:hypothetical protein